MPRFPAAFRLPAFASWVFLPPLRDWAFLAVGLPGAGIAPGPHRDFHVTHERVTTGSDAPYTPGRRCSPG
jgi:hypothetical protein